MSSLILKNETNSQLFNILIFVFLQSILIQKGARVRYSNPFDSECEYIAICLPAFSMELVNREEIS